MLVQRMLLRFCLLLLRRKNSIFSHDFGLQNELTSSNNIMHESIVFAFFRWTTEKKSGISDLEIRTKDFEMVAR